ncbi:spidroin-1-like [Papio anubis]|uniref:spidroin-1-like n=1 Tax=Papio anubis TaxID=9555 RepID=UPI0012AD3D09|nr:spidroin-1-like [Papio anubis]
MKGPKEETAQPHRKPVCQEECGQEGQWQENKLAFQGARATVGILVLPATVRHVGHVSWGAGRPKGPVKRWVLGSRLLQGALRTSGQGWKRGEAGDQGKRAAGGGAHLGKEPGGGGQKLREGGRGFSASRAAGRGGCQKALIGLLRPCFHRPQTPQELRTAAERPRHRGAPRGSGGKAGAKARAQSRRRAGSGNADAGRGCHGNAGRSAAIGGAAERRDSGGVSRVLGFAGFRPVLAAGTDESRLPAWAVWVFASRRVPGRQALGGPAGLARGRWRGECPATAPKQPWRWQPGTPRSGRRPIRARPVGALSPLPPRPVPSGRL